jgi:DHA2 family multidrug resistance protein
VDFLGIALLSACLVTLQYVLEEGQSKDWFDSNVIRICCASSAVLLVAFIIRELTAKAPVVDLSLFKDEVFLSGTVIGSMMFAMLMSLTFLLPLFMQEMLGFTATQSGLALMPRSLIMLLCMPLVGRLYNKVPARVFVAFGIMLFVFTAYRMSHYTLDITSRDVVDVLLLQGIAFSCLFIPLTTIALSQVPRHKMADATGLNSLIRQIGGSVGLAIFVSLLTRFSAAARYGLVAHLDPGRPQVMNRLASLQHVMAAGGMDPASADMAAKRALNGMIVQQSMVLSFEKLFLMAGILFLLVMPLLLFLKAPAKTQEAAHVHVEV